MNKKYQTGIISIIFFILLFRIINVYEDMVIEQKIFSIQKLEQKERIEEKFNTQLNK